MNPVRRVFVAIQTSSLCAELMKIYIPVLHCTRGYCHTSDLTVGSVRLEWVTSNMDAALILLLRNSQTYRVWTSNYKHCYPCWPVSFKWWHATNFESHEYWIMAINLLLINTYCNSHVRYSVHCCLFVYMWIIVLFVPFEGEIA